MKIRRHTLTIAALLLAARAAAQESAWISHGPTDVGLVLDLAVGDAAAFAATPNGVFRSLDGGASWAQSGLAGESVSQVLARPGTVVVLAMRRIPPDFEAGYLYASRDQGKSWPPVPGLPPLNVAGLDPWHRSTGYAGGMDGSIWRTTDDATSWQRISTTPTGSSAQSFAFDSLAVYVQSFDEAGGGYKLYRSSDGGASWTAVSPPLPYVGAYAGGATPGVVYTAGEGSFCRSADSAATWTCSSVPPYPGRILQIPGGDPGAPPRILVVCQNGVYVSRDEGLTWARAPGVLGTAGSTTAFASDASGSLSLAGTDAGIFRSEDRGDSWTPSSAGLQASTISALALDPNEPSAVWTVGPGLFRSPDNGLSWAPVAGQGLPLYPGFLVADPVHSSTLYAGGSAVYRSEDGGASWTSSPSPGDPYINALAVDPVSPQRVWEASYGGLFRSDDGAQAWNSPAAVAQEVYTVLFDGRQPGTMYAGSYFDVEPGFYGYPSGGSIFVSYDSGASWTKRARDLGSQVVAIATDPFHDGGLYAATYSAGVFRSADRGLTWQGPGLGLPLFPSVIFSLVADPVRSDRMYVTTDSGVYRTIDGAQTWQLFSSGLGSLQARSLVISPDGKWLHAGTIGGGVFELDLETSHTCSPTETRLCLVGNRYAVELLAARLGETPNQPGSAQPLSDRSGFFGLPFATGDPTLPEVAVKMLADGAFGVDGAPFFYASLTTLPYILTVTDTVTGRVEVHASDPDAPLCGATDLFGASSPWDYSIRLLSAPAAAGETALELLGGRFSVTLEARHPRTGQIASGVAMLSGDRFGIFSLPDFTGDPQFPEVVVKMVDFTSITGQFWFFYTGLTNLDYTLTVTDSVTGAVRTYASATPYCGGADIRAFTD